MKHIIIFSLICMFSACALKLKIKKIPVERSIYTENNDTLTVRKDSNCLELYTTNYEFEYENIKIQSKSIDLMRALEFKIDLSNESKKMIEKNGGMIAVLKKTLSKENYSKLDQRIFINLYGIYSLSDFQVKEFKVLILSRNIQNIQLSNREIIDLFDYFKILRFVYRGENLMKDEGKTTFGYTFGLQKKIPVNTDMFIK